MPEPGCPTPVPLPTRVQIAPGRDLTLADVVAASRGLGDGHFAEVVLDGDWRARCDRSAAYVRRLLDSTQGKDDAALAQLVRDHFRGAAPPALAALLAAPADHAGTARALASRALVYGVTTGFGNNKDKPLRTREEAQRMQLNLLRSHATGIGPPAPSEVVRATILLRIRSFIEGFSGVRPELVEFLCALLNRHIHPWVPQQGSVGSSGDLCPLSHLFLCVVGEGLGWREDHAVPAQGYAYTPAAGASRAAAWDVRDERRPAPRDMRELLIEAGIGPLEHLEPKEGIALTNGTTFSTAYAALAVYDASLLLDGANLAASLSLQALCGCTRAFDPKVHQVRRHAGQAQVARDILALAHGGSLLDSSDDVQDAYSLRCAPQVHGAAASAIAHARSVIEQEINAVTDNPLLFLDGQQWPVDPVEPADGYAKCIWQAYSAGNFHGEPVGMVMDYLKIAVAELASISERRTQHLLDANHNRGLPANLAADDGDTPRGGRKPRAGAADGLNSGLMIAQYAAASLVSENKVLAHPATVDSIPTSANAEDHVAMAPVAARHARQVLDNTRSVLAIEVLCAAQALEWRIRQAARQRRAVRLSPSAQAVLERIRQASASAPAVEYLESDECPWPMIAAIGTRLATGELHACARRAARSPDAV